MNSKNKNKYLVDASALVNMLPEISIDTLRDSEEVALYITQLTPFEVGNALWKLHIKGLLGIDDVGILMELVQKLIDNELIETLRITDFISVIKLSLRRRITFYDASYIATAKKLGLTIITDDNGLRTNAQIEGVIVLSSEEFTKYHVELFQH